MSTSQEFKLEIIQPNSTSLLSVRWIEVDGLESSFTVGPDHTPLVSILRPDGEINYTLSDGSQKKLKITAGIFSVSSSGAVIIFD